MPKKRSRKKYIRGRFEVVKGKKEGRYIFYKDKLGNVKYNQVVCVKKPVHPSDVPLSTRQKCEHRLFLRSRQLSSMRKRKSAKRNSTKRKSTKRKSTKRKSTRRKSTKRKSTRRKSTRRKSTKRKSKSKKN